MPDSTLPPDTRVSMYQPEQRGLRFPEIPTFKNSAEERLYRKRHLAAACRAFALERLDYGFAGHLTVRDPERPHLYWTNPMAVHFAQVKVSNLILVDHEGQVVEGEYAVNRGVHLGFENREKFEELPLDDDFDALIGGMATPHTAGYWHDTGHADIKHSMGMLEHRLHLEKNAPRLLGFHLHDVTADGKDHQPIGAGRIDFGMISGFWRPEHLLTLELSPRVSIEDVRVSKQRIEALMTARFGA